MAFYDFVFYCNAGDQSTTGYYAVPKRPQNTAVVAGQLCRQFTAPSVNNERVFVCIVAGTTANTTDATWVTGRGQKTTDGTATWIEVTGMAAVNGDATNTVNWTTAKATAVPAQGSIIKRDNGASYQICTTAGFSWSASEPAFSNTAGVTTVDASTTWTSLGPVGNFTGGQAPHARLAGAIATGWFVAGNTVFVGDNHAESQAGAPNYGPPGSANTVSKFLCHDHLGPYPPTSLMAGATTTTTGSNSITIGGSTALSTHYFHGISFRAGGAFNFQLVSGTSNYFTNCSFSAAGGNITLGFGGTNPCQLNWNNCTVSFGAIGNYIITQGAQFVWQNTGTILAGGSVVPTNLFSVGSAVPATGFSIIMEALDLSQITTSLFTNSGPIQQGTMLVKDCKLNASLAAPTMSGQFGTTIQYVRCDSGATGYKSFRYQYEGTEITETSITRVGGAADPTGQAQSRKIVTTANAQWIRPFLAQPDAVWNATTGANVTVTVCGTINAGTLPNNDDIWLEVEYLGSSATPLGTVVKTTKASLVAANAAVTSDGSTWNGGGSGAGWSPFKLVAVLSSPQPAMAGYIHARVRAAKPSTTYYLDPKVTLT